MNTQAHNFCLVKTTHFCKTHSLVVTASLERQFAQEKWSILYGEFDSWRNIPITLTDPQKGEWKAQACEERLLTAGENRKLAHIHFGARNVQCPPCGRTHADPI